MNWKLFAATLVLGCCLSTSSYASKIMMGSAGCGCEPTCGAEQTCGCEPTCGCDTGCKKCCKMKYWKKVCKTRTKRVRDCHGCKQKVCVTKVRYRRVLFPCKHCPSDLVCSCKRPCGYETCTPVCGCESTCGCETAPTCGCETTPTCGCE
ncbi:MAG: hypothetical protein DWQ46_07300 [Planctomycetota bacterium]|nr:MAG: hypothetical protein DWQ46_07300 [Planctomycetota bacterium]